MKCKFCGCEKTKVSNSREDKDKSCNLIRRRRKCTECGRSFTTIELPYSILNDIFTVYSGTNELTKLLVFGENYASKMAVYDTDRMTKTEELNEEDNKV